ncbi:protein-disulfide reductase DsbD N-terminal domain-containing protein [Leptolyngbya sp. 15MV]|nr:protein-disulfide reductase DsbD N-terminal domain-containing protein [Leptolyngbya sp. 15MV]
MNHLTDNYLHLILLMKRNAIFSLPIFLAVVLAASLTSSAQTVSGSIGNGTVAKGGTARGTIVLSIPGNLHVNSSRPNSEYLIPTSVALSTSGGVVVSRVTYPRGVNRRFQFSDKPINVYEGTVSFPFTVRVPSNFRGNTVTVNAVVRYQACNDEVCFPPRVRNITMTARVR